MLQIMTVSGEQPPINTAVEDEQIALHTERNMKRQ